MQKYVRHYQRSRAITHFVSGDKVYHFRRSLYYRRNLRSLLNLTMHRPWKKGLKLRLYQLALPAAISKMVHWHYRCFDYVVLFSPNLALTVLLQLTPNHFTRLGETPRAGELSFELSQEKALCFSIYKERKLVERKYLSNFLQQNNFNSKTNI